MTQENTAELHEQLRKIVNTFPNVMQTLKQRSTTSQDAKILWDIVLPVMGGLLALIENTNVGTATELENINERMNEVIDELSGDVIIYSTMSVETLSRLITELEDLAPTEEFANDLDIDDARKVELLKRGDKIRETLEFIKKILDDGQTVEKLNDDDNDDDEDSNESETDIDSVVEFID